MRIWVLLHIGGFVFWMGGAFSSMLIGIRGRGEDRATQAAVTRLQAALLRNLVAPGAAVAVASGLYLSALTMKANPTPTVWLILMQGAGIVAALLVFFVSLPTSARLSRINPVGEGAGLFDALRKRQATVGSIAGTLGILALIGGVFSKY